MEGWKSIARPLLVFPGHGGLKNALLPCRPSKQMLFAGKKFPISSILSLPNVPALVLSRYFFNL